MTGVKQLPDGAIYNGDTDHSRVHGEMAVQILPNGIVRVTASHFGTELVHMTYGEWAFLVGAVHRLMCSVCGNTRDECVHTDEERRGRGPYAPSVEV